MKSEKDAPVTDHGSGAADAIDLLEADYKTIRKLFKEFNKLSGKDSHAGKAQLAQQLCEAWSLHAALEQEILYPAAREVLEDARLVNHLDVQYAGMQELIGRIQQMEGLEPLYDATLEVLQEYIERHMEAEEKMLFPKLRKSKMHLHRLAMAMAQRREELTVELV